MLTNAGCPVTWGLDGFLYIWFSYVPSVQRHFLWDSVVHISRNIYIKVYPDWTCGAPIPNCRGSLQHLRGLNPWPRVQQPSTHCTLASEGFEPLTKGSWATLLTNCTLWRPVLNPVFQLWRVGVWPLSLYLTSRYKFVLWGGGISKLCKKTQMHIVWYLHESLGN